MGLSENFAVIVAAGKGLRMGSATKKQYLCLKGIPVLSRTLMAFEACNDIHEIVLVIPGQDHDYCRKHILDPFGFLKKIHLVAGGKERQASVLNGLNQVRDRHTPGKETIVLIHDGVRPFVEQCLIKESIEGAGRSGACIPAVKITDTVKQIGPDAMVEKTVDRALLHTVQTPQAFRLDLILAAFDHAEKTAFTGTDDASLVEHMGQRVGVIKGSKSNIKITTPEDLDWGEVLLNRG